MQISKHLILDCFKLYLLGGFIFLHPIFLQADVCEKKLEVFKNLNIGSCMDVAIEGNHSYIVGSGNLYIADITDPGSPLLKGKISGLGRVRQITVRDGTAYVTSREDGAFIVDVRNPDNPVLLCHYNSVEVATGIGLSGDVMFIANRGHGVELVDVSDPENPEFLSLVRTGEAQSVDIKDGYLYTGVHGAKFLVTADVRNPRKPVITSQVELDGQGDGIYIQGNDLFISTGNRSRLTPNRNEEDPGYDTGHGLEIYDLSDPARPAFVSRVKFDELHTFPDLWNVEVSGDYAFCSDTVNGMYIVDVTNRKRPDTISHFPVSELVDGRQDNYSGGLAVVNDFVYVAGGQSDLHLIEAKGVARSQNRPHDRSVKIDEPETEVVEGYHLLRPTGQVWAVDVIDELGIAACGMGGWCTFSLGPEPKVIENYPADGFALGIGAHGNHVYVANGKGGVEIWERLQSGSFARAGSYEASKPMAIKKFVILAEKPYALMQVGMSSLEMVDLSNPSRPSRILDHSSRGYINGVIGSNLLENRYAFANWHVKGLDWFDLENDPPSFTGKTLESKGIRGACAVDDKLVVFTYGGYKIVGLEDEDLDRIPEIKTGKPSLVGSPVLHGKHLFLSNRSQGRVSLVDMTELENPQVIITITTDGNPGAVKIHQGKLIIPDGYGGIRIYEDFINQAQKGRAGR